MKHSSFCLSKIKGSPKLPCNCEKIEPLKAAKKCSECGCELFTDKKEKCSFCESMTKFPGYEEYIDNSI